MGSINELLSAKNQRTKTKQLKDQRTRINQGSNKVTNAYCMW